MEKSWDYLEQRLADLKQILQRSDYAQLEPRVQETGHLLASLSNADPPTTTAEQIQRVVEAYRQCQLILAAHLQETNRQLKRVRSGKRIINAYAHHTQVG